MPHQNKWPYLILEPSKYLRIRPRELFTCKKNHRRSYERATLSRSRKLSFVGERVELLAHVWLDRVWLNVWWPTRPGMEFEGSGSRSSDDSQDCLLPDFHAWWSADCALVLAPLPLSSSEFLALQTSSNTFISIKGAHNNCVVDIYWLGNISLLRSS